MSASWDQIRVIEDGETIEVQGKQKGETDSSAFTYTVLYQKGSTAEGSNMRVDSVTNNRPGIVLKKQDWNGGSLQGTEFSLEDSSGSLIGTFTSDSDGLITTAFLRDQVPYTLTETKTPKGYLGLEAPMTITLHNGTVTVGGVDQEYYTLNYDTGTPVMTIRNRSCTFQVLKEDGDTHSPLAGTEFALHRQVTVDGTTAFDVNPMPGFESLITGSDGRVPRLDETLPEGTYELREKAVIEGYEPLSGHIHFTVSENGKITEGTLPDGVTFTSTQNDGTVSFVITVPNYQKRRVSVWKTNLDHDAITTGVSFELYKEEDFDDQTGQPAAGKSPVVSGTTGTNGILALGLLNAGSYRLVETSTPEGYLPADSAVIIQVYPDSVTAMQGTGIAEVARNVEGNPYREYWVEGQEDDTWQIRVWNNPGVTLPATGGTGTRSLTIAGALMTAGALFLLRRRNRRGR